MSQNGKGSRNRTVNFTKYRNHYDEIFHRKIKKVKKSKRK